MPARPPVVSWDQLQRLRPDLAEAGHRPRRNPPHRVRTAPSARRTLAGSIRRIATRRWPDQHGTGRVHRHRVPGQPVQWREGAGSRHRGVHRPEDPHPGAMTDARRISYQALPRGVPVQAAGGEEIGTVEHVLEVPELDVFDGIVLKTEAGLRFADADQVADITDRYVLLTLPAGEAERLGRPQAPAIYRADASEHAGGSLHDWFGRMFGRAHWKRDR